MNKALNKYLNPKQYNKICKYWKFMNDTSYKLEHEYAYMDQEYTELLIYYEQEYEKYINSIGFELRNRTYDELLFHLLNEGIVPM